MKYLYFKACPASEPLEDLEEADRLFRQMLSGNSILPSLNSFMAEQSLADDLDHGSTLAFALNCSCVAWKDHIRANSELLQ